MDPFSPELTERKSKKSTPRNRWRVIIYNNARHRFDDVVGWLQEYAQHPSEFAIEVCHVCEGQGRAVCFQGAREECHRVATALRVHGLQAEVDDY